MRCIAIFILCFTASLGIGGLTNDDGHQSLISDSTGVNVKHLCKSGIKKPSKETIDLFKRKGIHNVLVDIGLLIIEINDKDRHIYPIDILDMYVISMFKPIT